MAKPVSIGQPETNGQALHPVNTGIAELEEFARILSHLSGDKGFQRIKSLVSEMDDLRARNKELERAMEKSNIAKLSNLAAIQKVMNDQEELNKLCSQRDADLRRSQSQEQEAESKLRLAVEEVTALRKDLERATGEAQKAIADGKEKQANISGLQGSIAKLKETVKQAEKDRQAAQLERVQAKEQHDAVNRELQALTERTFPLQITSESALNEHKRQLRGLFEDAFRLVSRFFGELQLESLDGFEGKWQNFTQSHALAAIPLPCSNSESARQVRVAAILRLLSKVACDYIFQPVYLTEDGMEVAQIIDRLELLEAEWVRSIFLNIDREDQEGYRMKRADIARRKIVSLVGFLVTPAAETQDLDHELRQWFQKASKLWMTLQVLKPRIEAEFEVRGNVPGLVGWRAFPTPSPKDRNSTTASAQNGVKSKPDDKAPLALKDIATVICPRFLVTMDDERPSDLLMTGFVLLKAQTLTASQELEAATLRRGSGSHRSTQGKQRVVRTVLGGANESTDRLPFLY
ncbi:hypothetical protein KVR01_002045 [Diaporthe batatas]|uniref:uncharacterized protein n=1 Tax=Diaporthe batatas TaxID=748121 RepID=UPI001D0468FB|nr:uncharacterized protein KVR01_002045 [Diaporthe batatas]KAG8166356.1 hypothetical protein KVR01_002045 [Diaporthe batatas]